MRSLPPAERQRRWTMAEFVARLSGRYSARPYAALVGQSLKALGWQQRRDFSNEGAVVAIGFCPLSRGLLTEFLGQ